MEYQVIDFGRTAKLIQIKNKQGLQLDVSNFGARIVHLYVPEQVKKRNIVLGFNNAEEYAAKDSYFGATIGRVAGRIANGVAKIGDQTVQLTVQPKQNKHTLHGGPTGFDQKQWDYTILEAEDHISVCFSLKSPAGENGFPGNVQIDTTYTLNEANEWHLQYHAVSDEATLFNPTNHVYFNLTGDCTQAVDKHQLYVNSETFLEVDSEVIVTGKQVPVKQTAFDFTTPKELSEAFQSEHPQIKLIGGLDHPFILNKSKAKQLAAKLIAPDEQIAVEMYTCEPSVVIYSANVKADGPTMNGKQLVHHGGITLETQAPPGVNEHTELGSIVLETDQVYNSTTIFKVIYSAG